MTLVRPHPGSEIRVIGRLVNHYEILEKLGSGGMGEVYVARDSKLDRLVALKVLPPDLANDPERLGRFEREAKTLAAINHPNIVTIFSVEDAAIAVADRPFAIESGDDEARPEGEARIGWIGSVIPSSVMCPCCPSRTSWDT